MALMYITEYATGTGREVLQVPQEPPLAIQVITFTGTSAASAALNAATKLVSIQLDTAGHIQFAGTPTATTTTSRKHAADAVSFHGADTNLKVAAITA